MSQPEWSQPATHARHDLLDDGTSSFDTALHVSRYEWVRDTWCRPGMTVLDLGCGTGYGVGLLAAVAAEVVGVDFSATGLATARALHGTENTSFVEADLTSAGLVAAVGGARFDVVTSMETIEHLEDYFALVANAAGALRPDGAIVVATPNRRMTYERYPGRRHMDPSHVQEFTRLSLERTLQASFADVELFFQWIPGYWEARSTATTPSRVATLAGDWLPPRLVPVLRAGRARLRRTPPEPQADWTVEDVEIVPAGAHPDLEAEAFALIAVCHKPRPRVGSGVSAD